MQKPEEVFETCVSMDLALCIKVPRKKSSTFYGILINTEGFHPVSVPIPVLKQ